MRRWRGPDLITMQLPQVTPRAAAHTTNGVFANNTVNDRGGRRKPDAGLYIMSFFFSPQHSSCCVSQEFVFFYTFQIKPELTSSPLTTLLYWSFATSHPVCSLWLADASGVMGWRALWWLNRQQQVISYSIIHVKHLIFNGYTSVYELSFQWE